MSADEKPLSNFNVQHAKRLLPFRKLMGKLENLHSEISFELESYFRNLVDEAGVEMLCELGLNQKLSAKEFVGKEVASLARVQNELFNCTELLDEVTSICNQLESRHLDEIKNEA